MRLCCSRSLQQMLAGAMMFLCLNFLLNACTTSTQRVQGQQQPSLSERMDSYLTSEVKAGKFNGAVLVARKGQILLSKGYGLANHELSLPNTPITMFGIGAVTKAFTAMAILILQERSKLHIHDPICAYLPPCPHAWQPITIYQLLTHSSGIPDHFNPHGITVRQLEKEPLDFQPGSKFNYSNSDYVVLATLIEKVSGQAYGRFLQQNIFAPLHMTHTGYNYTQPHLPGMAVGYSALWEKRDYTGISLEFGADGLYSTVEDLYRWDQALFTHTQTLVSNQTLNEMFTNTVGICPAVRAPTCSSASAIYWRALDPPTSASPLSLRYGYGWCIATVEGSKVPIIYHPGATFGFKAYNAFFSEDNITIIVLSNLEVAVPRDIVQALHQIVTTKA